MPARTVLLNSPENATISKRRSEKDASNAFSGIRDTDVGSWPDGVVDTKSTQLANDSFISAEVGSCLEVSLLVRYGENSGDSMHAEPHFGTSCHYQIFF